MEVSRRARRTDAGPVLDLPGLRLRAGAALPGVRAVAVVQRVSAREVAVVASAGYDCASMGAGARLPLDSGLPVTEAVRTNRPVVQGTGPSWVAVPFGGVGQRGALLLSLTGEPGGPAGLAAARRMAREAGNALAAVTLPPAVALTGWQAAVRSVPYDGRVGGDVLLALPDPRGGTWLVAADVCGSGLAAAAIARTVSLLVGALATSADGPAELLAAVDRGLRRQVAAGSFVTAVVVHVARDALRVASAGHPAPVLLSGAAIAVLPVDPGVPLALEVNGDGWSERVSPLPPGATLLLHTDGLVDRRDATGVRVAELPALVADLDLADLEAAADLLLQRAAQWGEPTDDLSLLLVRPACVPAPRPGNMPGLPSEEER